MNVAKHNSKNSDHNKRAAPGTKGSGNFYHIELRPKEEFVLFRTQDVGDPGGLERRGGQRIDGSWDTQAWLVSKDYAHIEGDKLVADHQDAKNLFDKLGAEPTRVKGDTFVIKPQNNTSTRKK